MRFIVSEGRKASDILLELESKIDQNLFMIKSLDLNMKILSNKVNILLEAINSGAIQNSVNQSAPHATTDNELNPQLLNQQFNQTAKNAALFIEANNNLKVEDQPKGHRRTSRGQEQPTIKPAPQSLEKVEEIIVPDFLPTNSFINTVAVQQRVVDANGKAIFLAEVEIINLTTQEPIPITNKITTKANGRWQYPLAPGKYQVIIRKRESINKFKFEIKQNILVDGSTNTLKLNDIIAK